MRERAGFLILSCVDPWAQPPLSPPFATFHSFSLPRSPEPTGTSTLPQSPGLILLLSRESAWPIIPFSSKVTFVHLLPPPPPRVRGPPVAAVLTPVPTLHAQPKCCPHGWWEGAPGFSQRQSWAREPVCGREEASEAGKGECGEEEAAKCPDSSSLLGQELSFRFKSEPQFRHFLAVKRGQSDFFHGPQFHCL